MTKAAQVHLIVNKVQEKVWLKRRNRLNQNLRQKIQALIVDHPQIVVLDLIVDQDQIVAQIERNKNLIRNLDIIIANQIDD